MKRIVLERENGSRRIRLVPEGESRVEQSHKDACDINSMVAKARRGQFVPPVSRGVYGDFTQVTDFQSAMNQIKAAEATFNFLPSHIRKRFDNDPQKVLAFMDDPDNLDDCYELGLLDRPKVVREEPEAPPVDPPPEAEAGA